MAEEIVSESHVVTTPDYDVFPHTQSRAEIQLGCPKFFRHEKLETIELQKEKEKTDFDKI